MSPRPPFFHRAVALMALSCLLPQAERAQEQDDLVEDLLRRFWGLAPDLATPEVRAAIVGDLKARILAGPSLGRACGELGDLLDRWVNAGREPVVVYDDKPAAGAWGALVRFRGPGDYLAESYRCPEGERGEVEIVSGLETLPAATEAAQRRSAERQHMQALLDLPPDEFTRRFGIVDDIVREPPTPEQRGALEAWHEEVLAKRGPLPVSRTEWGPEDAFDHAQRMAMNTARDAAMLQGLREASARADAAAERARHLREAFSPVPDADGNITQAEMNRQLAEFEAALKRRGPSSIEIVGGDRRTMRRLGLKQDRPRYRAEPRIEASLHPAGKCTCEGAGAGVCSWCVMNRRREARDDRPTRRDGQASRRRQRAGQKARRGW